jgi:predicted acetyltransferase
VRPSGCRPPPWSDLAGTISFFGKSLPAAHRIFSAHAGKWEVRQRAANVAATAFWRRAIAAFTAGRLTEELVDDERWKDHHFLTPGG